MNMLFFPCLLAIFITSSTLLDNNKEQEVLPSNASVEESRNSGEEGISLIDPSPEAMVDEKRETYCQKKIGPLPHSFTLQHSTSTLPSTFSIQSAPPTKHPIERKTVKAISAYIVGSGAFLSGIQGGIFLAICFDLSFEATIGLSVALGIVAGAITIHYTWRFINSWFSK